MSVIVKLSKPLLAGDVEITELELRDATVDDVAELGYPFTVADVDGATEIKIVPKIVLKYTARLAALPPSTLKGLAIKDLFTLQNTVMGFFGDEAATSLT